MDFSLLSRLGSAVNQAKKDTIGTIEFAKRISKEFGEHGAAFMRVTIDESLIVLEESVLGRAIRTVYGVDGIVMLVLLNHGTDPRMPLMVHLSVNHDLNESGVIVVDVYPLLEGETVPYSGHLWFGNVKDSVGAGSNGMVDVHARKIASMQNMRARFEHGLLSFWAHFIEGFTYVFVSALDAGIDPSFFRVMTGFFPTKAISINSLGVESGEGDFFDFGAKYIESKSVTEKLDQIALQYAFREGVGSFNFDHLKKMSATEKNPEPFAKACMRRIEVMAERGLFTLIFTQKGWFYMPTPEFLLSLK